jgi:hypothetical protein
LSPRSTRASRGRVSGRRPAPSPRPGTPARRLAGRGVLRLLAALSQEHAACSGHGWGGTGVRLPGERSRLAGGVTTARLVRVCWRAPADRVGRTRGAADQARLRSRRVTARRRVRKPCGPADEHQALPPHPRLPGHRPHGLSRARDYGEHLAAPSRPARQRRSLLETPLGHREDTPSPGDP